MTAKHFRWDSQMQTVKGLQKAGEKNQLTEKNG